MVPEGWKDATLGDLVKLQRGHDLPSQNRIDGEVKVIGGGGPNGFHNVAKAKAPGIVIGRSGSGIGNAWWSDEDFWPLNTGMYVIDYLGNDPRFCFLWLDWIDFTSHNSGGAQPSLNRNFIYPIPLPIPPLPEQRKIVDILSTWDQAIKKTEALLSNARTQKRALMQQLLTGKRRFPAFEGQPWKEVRLGDVVKIDWGNTSITKKSYVDSGVDAYSAAGRDGYVADAEFSGAGIVLSAIGARCGRCFWADGDWTAIKNTIVIREQPDHCDLRFLYQIVNDARFWPISGGAQPFIGLKNARNAKVKLPPLCEQQRVAEVLNVADSLIADLVRDITKLRKEKKALMQQLLTGKRRVVIDA